MALVSMDSGFILSVASRVGRFVAIIILTASVLGCSFTLQPNDADAETKVVPVGEVKPELDYSLESPGCEVAALRIGDNIQVGMTRADVKRLVGQPRFNFAGTWYWSRGFTKSGLPIVRFQASRTDKTVIVRSFSTETSACEG